MSWTPRRTERVPPIYSFSASEAAHISSGRDGATSVGLFDQGLIQIIQAAVTGLEPKSPYVLALSLQPDGSGPLEPIATFTTNPAGAAIVDTTGPTRQIVRGEVGAPRCFLVIAAGTAEAPGQVVQLQQP